MRVAIGVVVGTLLVGLATSRSASADQGEDPESLIHQGIELRKRGEDLRAVGYFMRAYRLARTPRSAVQLGLVELAVDQYADANRYLSEALGSDDPWVTQQHVILEDSRAKARAHLGIAEISGARDGATVRVGKLPPEPVPPDGKIWLAPGSVTLVIESGGRSVEEEVTVVAGQKVLVALDRGATTPPPTGLTSAASPAEAAQPNEGRTETSPVTTLVDGQTTAQRPTSRRGMSIAGLATGGVGLAAIVAGIVCRSIATTKYDAVIHSTPQKPSDAGDFNYRSYDRAGVGLLIGGGVAVAAGVTLFVLGRQHRERESGAGMAFNLGVERSGISIGGHF
jgi:hypothetical protein